MKPQHPAATSYSDASRWVYRSPVVSIGRFRCPPSHSAWRSENCIDSGPIVVFPRVPVLIKQADKPPVVADANCVMLYNARQPYHRGLLDPRGDACEFFAVDSSILAELVAEYEPPVQDHPDSPFKTCTGPSDSRNYLAQRRLFEYVAATDQPDQLLVDEMALNVIRRSLGLVYRAAGTRRPACRPDTDRSHRDIVEAARELLSSTYQQRLSLAAISSRVHASPFHLCRIFRRLTGSSIHQYVNELRLRASLELLAEKRSDLTAIALRLGFSSHAHFSSTFQSTFGVSPTAFRRGRTLPLN